MKPASARLRSDADSVIKRQIGEATFESALVIPGATFRPGKAGAWFDPYEVGCAFWQFERIGKRPTKAIFHQQRVTCPRSFSTLLSRR